MAKLRQCIGGGSHLQYKRGMRHGSATRRRHDARPGNARLPLAIRYGGRRDEAAPDALARDAVLARVEAVLMMADEPLSSRRVAEVAGLADGRQARSLIEELQKRLVTDGSAFQVEEFAGGFQLLTTPCCHTAMLRLRRAGHDLRLTSAGLETLAVIAYKQPIMRAEIEKIRGVACAELIRLLMEKGLVRVTGRHDSLGRPQLFGTTKRFLQYFGLDSLDDLPEVATLPKPAVS